MARGVGSLRRRGGSQIGISTPAAFAAGRTHHSPTGWSHGALHPSRAGEPHAERRMARRRRGDMDSQPRCLP
eukprot:504814-Prymnesium_polylepis.1